MHSDSIRIVLDPESRGRLAAVLVGLPRPEEIPPDEWRGIKKGAVAALTTTHIETLRTAAPLASTLFETWGVSREAI